MNAVEEVTSKICSAREILDCAMEAHEQHKYDKVNHLLHAVDEFLVYYLSEFDNKFKDAWKATVGDLRDGDVKDDGMRPWGHSDLEYLANDILTKDRISNFPGEQYTDEELNAMCDKAEADEKKDKVKKWVLPVEETKDVDTDEIEYFVTFPDDLLEAANLKEGDQVEWVDNGNGSYLLKKVEKSMTYDEATKAGWKLGEDNIWLPPQEC